MTLPPGLYSPLHRLSVTPLQGCTGQLLLILDRVICYVRDGGVGGKVLASGEHRPGVMNAEDNMATIDKTYKIIELVGVSEQSTEDAIHNALDQASQTLKG